MIRLGQRFRYARKKKNITLEQASKDLRIRSEFLQALEKGEYKELPSSAYVMGFVGNYAQYLGLSKKETVAMFRREFDEEKEYTVLPDKFTNRTDFKVHKFRFPQLGILVVIILGIFGYILFQYRFAFLDPLLEVSSPVEKVTLHTTEVTVVGRSDPNATIFVNNDAVSVNKDGTFRKQLGVFEGETVITISAVNRFGKKSTIERRVTVVVPHE